MRTKLVLYALAVAAFSILFIIAKDCYFIGFFNDDAYQIIGARSILKGMLREINNPFLPAFIDYFPGWPLLLAPMVYLFPASIHLYHYYAILFSLGSIIIAFFLLRDNLDGYGLISWGILSFFNPLYISLSGTLNQEPSFTFFSLLSLLLITRLLRAHPERYPAAWYAGIVISLSMVLYIRPTGIVLLGAVGLLFLMRRHYKDAVLYAGIPLAALTPLLVRNMLSRQTPMTYLSQFKYSHGLLRRSGSGFVMPGSRQFVFFVKKVLVQTFFRMPESVPSMIIITAGCAAVFLLIIGMLKKYKQSGILLIKIYLAGYMLLHCIWPLEATRYYFPVLMLIAFFIVQGACYVVERYRLSRAYILIPGILSFLLSLQPNSTIFAASRYKNTIQSKPPSATIDWIMTHTEKTDIIGTGRGGALHILTDRKTIEIIPRLHNLKKYERRIRYYVLGSDEMSLNKKSIYGTEEFDRILKNYTILFHVPEEKAYILDLSVPRVF